MNVSSFIEILRLVRPWVGGDGVMFMNGLYMSWSAWARRPVAEKRETHTFFPLSLFRFSSVVLGHWELMPALPKGQIVKGRRFVFAAKQLVQHLPGLICTGRISGQRVWFDGEWLDPGQGMTTSKGFTALTREVSSVLRDGKYLTDEIIARWRTWMMGSIGARPQVRKLNEAMSKCWWFPDWLEDNQASPTETAQLYFIQTWSILKDGLTATLWPSSDWHADGSGGTIEQRWPSEAELLVQFSVLWQRVMHLLLGDHSEKQALRCMVFDVDEYEDDFLKMPFSGHLWKACHIKGRREKRNRLLDIAGVAEAFGSTFTVKPQHLADVFMDELGSTAKFGCGMLAKPIGLKHASRLNGYIVRIKICREPLNQDSLLQVMESRASISVNCWHAMRILHRCRRLGDCEAIIESWGSLLDVVSDKRQQVNQQAYINRLKLKTAGVTALGGDDDVLVRRVADAVRTFNPFLIKSARRHKTFSRIKAAANAKFIWRDVIFAALGGKGFVSDPNMRLSSFLSGPVRATQGSRQLPHEACKRVHGAHLTSLQFPRVRRLARPQKCKSVKQPNRARNTQTFLQSAARATGDVKATKKAKRRKLHSKVLKVFGDVRPRQRPGRTSVPTGPMSSKASGRHTKLHKSRAQSKQCGEKT